MTNFEKVQTILSLKTCYRGIINKQDGVREQTHHRMNCEERTWQFLTKGQMLFSAENVFPINGARTRTDTISQKQSTFNVYFCCAYMLGMNRGLSISTLIMYK